MLNGAERPPMETCYGGRGFQSHQGPGFFFLFYRVPNAQKALFGIFLYITSTLIPLQLYTFRLMIAIGFDTYITTDNLTTVSKSFTVINGLTIAASGQTARFINLELLCVCVYVCIYVCTCICMYVFVCVYLRTYVCVCMNICTYMSTGVCV